MNKNKENINNSLAVFGQALLLLFVVPFCLFLLYFIIAKNLAFEGIAFVLAILVLCILVVVHAYTYADLYLEGDNIIIKKLFHVKFKPLADYKTVEQAILPLKYYILFQDGSKVYFVLAMSSMFRHVTSTDPDRILKELRLKLNKLKQEKLNKD